MSPSLPFPRDEALRKADLTGFIADAQGVYHDLTKGAFDAFSMKHPHEVIEDISDKLLEQPLLKGIKDIADAAGVDLTKFGELDPAGVAANMARYLGTKLKGLTVAGVAEAGAYLGGSTVATGGAAAVGFAIEAALEWAMASFERDGLDTYMRGDWVAVDHGQKTIKKVDESLEWGMNEAFEDAPDISEIHVLARVDDFHIGFFVAYGEEESTVSVFDILSGEVQRHYVNMVSLLPVANRVALDNDEVASKIRELFFMKRDNIHFDSAVSTDPGTEVIFQDVLYNIVHTDNDVALIEDAEGQRKHVGISQLKRSRQERVGPTYIYKQGLPKPNTGFATTAVGFGTGDWVWYEVGNGYWELAVVHIINADKVVVYCTVAGNRKELEVSQVRVASRADSDTYNRMRVFTLFKVAAIAGEQYNTERLVIPAKFSPIFYKKNPDARWEPVQKSAVPVFRLNKNEEPVQTGDRAARVDQAVEAQLKFGGTQGADEYMAVADEEDECRRRLMQDGFGDGLCRPTPADGPLSRPGKRKREEAAGAGAPAGEVPTSGKTTFTFEPSYLLVGAAVVAFFYFR